jgi:transposase
LDHWSTAKGTSSPLQRSDGLILVSGLRLEGHSVIFLAIQTHLSCRFLLAVDSLGWHGAKDLKVPDNITLLPLPPCAPELNPVENIWQFMRDNWPSNRVFKSYEDILDQCCFAWNQLTLQPWKIMSIGLSDWAYV